MELEPIAHVRDGADGILEIAFEGVYRNAHALRGIEGFSHLWIIWGDEDAERESAADERVSSGLGLALAQLDEVAKTRDAGTVLRVVSDQLPEGAAVYDVKPYIAYADAHPGEPQGE